MCSYLKSRIQRTQINIYFSLEINVIAGVPQDYLIYIINIIYIILFYLITFDLFINDLILFLTQFFSSIYKDSNNLYSTGDNLELGKMYL